MLFRDGLAELLELGQSKGHVLRSVDPNEAAALIVSIVLGIELMCLLDSGFDFPAAARRVEANFLDQLCSTKGARRRRAV